MHIRINPLSHFPINNQHELPLLIRLRYRYD